MEFKVAQLQSNEEIAMRTLDVQMKTDVHRVETEAELKAQIELLKNQLGQATLQTKTELADKQIETNKNIDLLQLHAQHEQAMTGHVVQAAHHATQHHENVTFNKLGDSVDANVTQSDNNKPAS